MCEKLVHIPFFPRSTVVLVFFVPMCAPFNIVVRWSTTTQQKKCGKQNASELNELPSTGCANKSLQPVSVLLTLWKGTGQKSKSGFFLKLPVQKKLPCTFFAYVVSEPYFFVFFLPPTRNFPHLKRSRWWPCFNLYRGQPTTLPTSI